MCKVADTLLPYLTTHCTLYRPAFLAHLFFFRFVCEISKDLAFRKKCARSCVMPKIGEGKYICLSELFCIVTEIQVLMNLRLELVLSPTAKKFISTM